jgi:hypothetical protein
MNIRFKLEVTPEQSQTIQLLCFSLGIDWNYGKLEVKLTEKPFLYVDEEGITCSGEIDREYFLADSLPLVTYDEAFNILKEHLK